MSSKPTGQIFVVMAYLVALLAALAIGRTFTAQHPVWVAALGDVVATLVVFGFSIALDNSSVYDPYWSVAPLPIAIYWTASAS
ncbi:MAG TPA: hypothetical protein VIM14_18250, partial [Polyangia bacterium]